MTHLGRNDDILLILPFKIQLPNHGPQQRNIHYTSSYRHPLYKSPKGDTALFKKLTPDELATLNRSRIELSFKKGEIINKQGAFASNIFFIIKGITKTYIEKGNTNLILSIVPAGSLIGLQSITVDNVFHYSTKALIDTDIYSYDINHIKNLMNQNIKRL